MSGEFYEDLQPPSTGEQFLVATTQVSILHYELLRRKLGDEFLETYNNRLALERFAVDILASLPDEQVESIREQSQREWDETVQEKTFDIMEHGEEPDPREAEILATTEITAEALTGNEDDQRHFDAVMEINTIIAEAFGIEGIRILPSRYTWRLDALGGISPNLMNFITDDFEPGLAVELKSDGDEIAVKPYRQFPKRWEEKTGHPMKPTAECFTDVDYATFRYLVEEVVRRLQERVIPALQAELTA